MHRKAKFSIYWKIPGIEAGNKEGSSYKKVLRQSKGFWYAYCMYCNREIMNLLGIKKSGKGFSLLFKFLDVTSDITSNVFRQVSADAVYFSVTNVQAFAVWSVDVEKRNSPAHTSLFTLSVWPSYTKRHLCVSRHHFRIVVSADPINSV